MIEGVTPFHVAVNQAAAAARGTPYFLQVDADMLLDEQCLASLRAAARPDVGIVTGALRDRLVGPINGIKLFRRECFEAVQCSDTLAWDSDFYTELVAHGLLTVNVLADRERFEQVGHTFGEHRPAYTPSYTYATYYLLGRKYSLRVNGAARIKWRLEKLRASRDPVALVARAALGHGVFSGLTRDVSKPAVTVADELLSSVLQGNGATRRLPFELLDGEPERVCDVFYELGRTLRSEGAFSTLRSWMVNLAGVRMDVSWIAEVSLHHGFLAVGDGVAVNGRVYERLRDLLEA